MSSSDRPRVVVLDDDPTGTQSVSDVPIVLRPNPQTLRRVAGSHRGSAWVLTNTRALPVQEATTLLRDIALQAREAFGQDVRLVLRGDSTLRGHVLEEIDVLASLGPRNAVALFVPAYLEQGRVTVEGIHYLERGGRRVEVGRTEYAKDAVFGYRSSRLVDWVRERDPARVALPLAARDLRARGPRALANLLLEAPDGAVVVPDAETAADLTAIHEGMLAAERAGRQVVLRASSSLTSLVAASPPREVTVPGTRGPILVVCASHTAGAAEQVRSLQDAHDVRTVIVDADLAVHYADAAATKDIDHLSDELAGQVERSLRQAAVTLLMTPRTVRREHRSLDAGERIMNIVVETVRRLTVRPTAVVTKGGITSARVARDGFGVATAWVRGQPAPGVPLWSLAVQGRPPLPYVVVPGNVGGSQVIADLVHDLLQAERSG